MSPPYAAIVSAPGFAIGIRCRADALTALDFLAPQPAAAATTPLAARAAAQLRAWLADPHARFDLPLAAAGTTFQNRVWQAIAAIPTGRTRSYGDIAKDLASAARAVGQACGANPYPIVIPCHRVVGSGWRGGFAHAREGALLDVKQWLLAHEAHR